MAAKTGSPGRAIASGYGNPPTGTTGARLSGFDASGPWYIETQKMDITYVRVPNYTLSAPSLGLSSVTATYNILDTHLLCIVEAKVSNTSSTANYTTSSYSQNQKFAINNVSSDSYGGNYGSLNASNAGPAGQFYTASSYINRVLLSSIPSYYASIPGYFGTSSFTGCNFVLAGGDNTMGMVDTSTIQTESIWDFKKSNRANLAGSFLPGPDTNPNGEGFAQPPQDLASLNVVDQPIIYPMIGTYDPLQETYFQLTQAIDDCGYAVQTHSLAGVPPVTGTTGSNMNLMGFNDGISGYQPNRHDYT